MEYSNVSVNNIILKDTLVYGETALLSYRIEYPEFSSPEYAGCLNEINRFYKGRAVSFERYCKNRLYRMAVRQYRDDLKYGYPVRAFDIVQVYEVTYMQSCIISLYTDQYEFTGGAHGNTVRKSENWNLDNCRLIRLEQLINCAPDYKSYIMSLIEPEIAKNSDIFFKNYSELIRSTFNKNNFYLAPDGIVVFYQQYDIAPYSSGIREFLLPYSSCITDPLSLCQ
jgi:hypothetical protein